MLRIGLIGSESTHAEAFASIVNKEKEQTGQFLYPDFQLTAILGEGEERTRELAERFHISNVIRHPEEMLPLVDAVMIVLRDGNLHLPNAMPFLKARIPVWIDKPVTSSNEDCYQLLHAAKTYQTLITGGSTCRYMEGVQQAKQLVNNPFQLGQPLGASLNYPADTESEYGGFTFYAPHLCEMCLQIFGHKPLSVMAMENQGSVSALVRYKDYNIVLNFLKDAPEHVILLHGTKTTVLQEIDSPILPYYNGFRQFADMLQSKVMPLNYQELYASVALMNAIIQSYTLKKEVTIEMPEDF